MTFEKALQDRLARNAELVEEAIRADEEMDRAEERRREEAERRAREHQATRDQRHAELSEHIEGVVSQLVAAGDPSFVAHASWSTSNEELFVKVSSRQLRPARTLSLTLDRDDDQVLARWASDLGNALELYHLLEVTPEMLTELVLQAVDQDLWDDSDRTPPFPGNPD